MRLRRTGLKMQMGYFDLDPAFLWFEIMHPFQLDDCRFVEGWRRKVIMGLLFFIFFDYLMVPDSEYDEKVLPKWIERW